MPISRFQWHIEVWSSSRGHGGHGWFSCRRKEAECLPLQWKLHPGDQTEVDQILHQSLLVLQLVDDSAAAGQLQVLAARRGDLHQLGQRLRLHDLKADSVGRYGRWPLWLAKDWLTLTYLVDLMGEVRAGGHVVDAERLVGWVVEEALVESGGEEAQRRAAVDKGESQQAAHVEVQVLMQSCGTHTHARTHDISFNWLMLMLIQHDISLCKATATPPVVTVLSILHDNSRCHCVR